MEIYTMKNARQGEMYSVMNSANNPFAALDKYSNKKDKMAHAESKINILLYSSHSLSMSHTYAVISRVGTKLKIVTLLNLHF